MATIVKQLQSKAVQASHVVQKHGGAYYKQLLEQNKHYIASEPTVEKCQELSRQLFYTRLASLPGRYKAFWEELDYVKQKAMNRNDLKLEEVAIAALFAGECYAWYCVGEIVGRGGTITGYKV
ncbi:hypothetical protein R1sor_020549 [Riccia sorocarpa]|uniref:Mitochondrial ATP synthase subunit G protein n=1 Tax=Riccia sorocarpa TaxID=122646 RepID=A0ABD3IFW0_9MARC